MTDAQTLRWLLAACDRYVDVQGVVVDDLVGTGCVGEDLAVALRVELDQFAAAVREAHLMLAEQEHGAVGSGRA